MVPATSCTAPLERADVHDQAEHDGRYKPGDKEDRSDRLQTEAAERKTNEHYGNQREMYQGGHRPDSSRTCFGRYSELYLLSRSDIALRASSTGEYGRARPSSRFRLSVAATRRSRAVLRSAERR
jgi:hypothetical protein